MLVPSLSSLSPDAFPQSPASTPAASASVGILPFGVMRHEASGERGASERGSDAESMVFEADERRSERDERERGSGGFSAELPARLHRLPSGAMR
eukprot:3154691-Rhodomonas_salina.1